MVGPQTFVPLTWLCKKQHAVSHSSTESEVIALDTCIRLEGLPALNFMDAALDVLCPLAKSRLPSNKAGNKCSPGKGFNMQDPLGIDQVGNAEPPLAQRARLLVLEDNDAVIATVIKGRSPVLKHCNRTQRIALDWLLERLQTDPGVSLRYVQTKEQIADIFTKAGFQGPQWSILLIYAHFTPQ